MAREKRAATAPEKKVIGRPFQKGNKSGGRKPLPADVKAARHMAYEDMLRTVIDVRLMTVKDAKKINPESLPLGKRAILSAYIKVNHKAITEYENRLFGRAPETIQITDNKTSEDRDLLGALLGSARKEGE